MEKHPSLYVATFFTIVAAIAIVVFFMEKKKAQAAPQTQENFAGLGVSFKVKADPEIRDNSGYFYSVPPNLQAALSPRFSGTASYGPYLNYKMPRRDLQSVPINPLTYQNTIKKCGDDVKESFDTIQPNFTSMNYAQVDNKLQARKDMIVNDLLPEMMAESAMSVAQPIVYDRYIYANQRSRLFGLGDPIRGDLPIVPYNGDWFRPSVQPNIDLRDGAMMVMAGQDNATARNTMALMRQSSGNTLSTFAGAPVMATETNIGYAAGGADVLATAFP